MTRWPRTLAAIAALALPSARADEPPAPAPRSETALGGPFLFSSFRGNGEDGLHLAYSHDGLVWTALQDDRSFLAPGVGGGLMRDPCIARGPDGVFHMVWTTGWFDRGIGVAHSKDLVHWSEQRFVPVMEHEPDAFNCWAPEILYDAEDGDFLVYWSTTIAGRFPETDGRGEDLPRGTANHRAYCATTRDFETWTPTRVFYDDGFSVIDATLVALDDRYAMVVKDETLKPEPRKDLRVAFGDGPKGPFGAAGPPFTEAWVEGASALRVGDAWYVYFDAYTRHRYEAAMTRDFRTFEPLTERISFPPGTRHGTAFPVPSEILETLLRTDDAPPR